MLERDIVRNRDRETDTETVREVENRETEKGEYIRKKELKATIAMKIL